MSWGNKFIVASEHFYLSLMVTVTAVRNGDAAATAHAAVGL